MLEAKRDECADREHDADHFAGSALAGHSEPHGKADEHVGENASRERLRRGQGELGLGDANCRSMQGFGVVDAAQDNKPCERQRASRIGGIRPGPVAPDFPTRRRSAQARNRHEAVAGRQLCASDDDQDQPEAERQATEPSRRAVAEAALAHRECRQSAAEPYVEAAENAERHKPLEWQHRFCAAPFADAVRGLGRWADFTGARGRMCGDRERHDCLVESGVRREATLTYGHGTCSLHPCAWPRCRRRSDVPRMRIAR